MEDTISFYSNWSVINGPCYLAALAILNTKSLNEEKNNRLWMMIIFRYFYLIKLIVISKFMFFDPRRSDIHVSTL
jgi:hypothetical protein